MKKRRIKLKVCGMRDNINDIAILNPDFLGFIFFNKSPRNIDMETFQPDLSLLDEKGIKKVGVFVNAEATFIDQCISRYALHLVQLHGNETPEFCKTLKSKGIQIIKNIPVSDTEKTDFSILERYDPYVDYFLFDTKTTAHGGSGISYDWEILKQNPVNKPYFLSGGVDLENITKLSEFQDDRLFAIDVNSKFELKPGLKDPELVKTLIARLAVINNNR